MLYYCLRELIPYLPYCSICRMRVLGEISEPMQPPLHLKNAMPLSSGLSHHAKQGDTKNQMFELCMLELLLLLGRRFVLVPAIEICHQMDAMAGVGCCRTCLSNFEWDCLYHCQTIPCLPQIALEILLCCCMRVSNAVTCFHPCCWKSDSRIASHC